MTTTTAPAPPTEAAKPKKPKPVDVVVGHREIEALFDAKQRTSNKWQQRGILPAPDFLINATVDWWLPCWWLSTIEAWAAESGRTINAAARRRLLRQAGALTSPAVEAGANRTKAKWPTTTPKGD